MAISSEARSIALATSLGKDVLVLEHMKATEQLGRLFSFQLELASETGEIAFSDVLGQNMTVRMELANPNHDLPAGPNCRVRFL